MHSWNRYPCVTHRQVVDVDDRHACLPDNDEKMLVYGNGRSYGDVCLNDNGVLLRSRRMNRFIAFDRETGRITCESGVLLKDILDLVVPQGWFLPVTPGTRFVTVGGAIANDVHGKNHHVNGSFGHHICELELLRSDGGRFRCSRNENSDWFTATIGGLGLTGMIVWAQLQLMPVSNTLMITEEKRFSDLESFWMLNAESERYWPYTVAWIDCLATGKRQGRGILMRAKHAPPQASLPPWKERARTFPFDPPFSLVNKLSLRLFNQLYYHRPLRKSLQLANYVSYFFPLDNILEWNRIYGRKGFFQYQCVIPPPGCQQGIRDLLSVIAKSGTGSFLAVLKTFGNRPAAGMLSFPRIGATLALDFPNHGKQTLELFNELDIVVRTYGGALYPAKDARMSGELFRAAQPQWQEFSQFIDPQFSSGFWRRVME